MTPRRKHLRDNESEREANSDCVSTKSDPLPTNTSSHFDSTLPTLPFRQDASTNNALQPKDFPHALVKTRNVEALADPRQRSLDHLDSQSSGSSAELLSGHRSPSQDCKTRKCTTNAGDWWHQLYVAWVLIFFAGSSLGAIFINKTCLTGYHFRYPLTLMLGQLAFAVILLAILHVLGYNKIPHANSMHLSVLIVPTALFTGNVVVGLSALSLVNIPMFSAFRRLTLLFVMGAEYIFLNKTHSPAIMQAVIVMTIGAFISAVDDVSFSRLGYCLVFVNNVLTAAYLASIKKAMKETNFDPLALLYYVALLGFPLVASLLMMTGELAHVIVAFRTQPELGSWGFLVSLLLTATGAFAVNYSTSLCTHVTSPLTTSVAGQVKNVLQTVLGFFSWGFVPTRMNTIGLLVALGAQIWFGYLKYQERRAGSMEKKDVQKRDVMTEKG